MGKECGLKIFNIFKMETYRFKTQISENGTVAIPNELHLEMQNVEIFVLYNKEIKKETINMASDFIA
ncbi:MAG: hypothetical protein EAZ27_12775, partial [Cytophagales bacterium]